MRAGVRHGTTAQVIEQLFQLRLGEGIVRFHRVAANGFRHYILSETPRIDLLPGCLKRIDDLQHELFRMSHLHERRQGIHKEGSVAELADPDPQLRENRDLLPQKIRVTRREFHRFRQEQPLRRRFAVFHAREKLLEKNAFVRRMLIE